MPQKPRLLRRLSWYRRRVESLEQQAVVDELTGLRNQRALWRELRRRIPVCSSSHPLAVLMLDFDLFKEVNDGYGHIVGDAVLRRAAGVLRSEAGSPRLVFRYRGEEFVVLADVSEDDAVELAERVRSVISHQNGALPAVTASCGIAIIDEPIEPWVALDRADAALHRAKRTGRNRVVVAGIGDDSPTNGFPTDDLEHETARRAAIALAVATLQARDTDTAHHSDDVVTICEAIGRRLSLGERELQHLRAGAQLHDVGKVAIPSSILDKPGALDEDEWRVIREHTILGERILRSVPEMAEVATIVRHSHEHWDGSGYPDGLAGESIPLASRVILCADAFHAIRSDRPYRRGRPASEAVAELNACAGTQFDPAVVDVLAAVAAEARTTRGAVGNGRPTKRLVVLLTTLVIGSGSAIAAIPEVRDAIKSVFAAGTPPTHAAPHAIDAQDFGLGPLGELLTMEPAEHRAGKNGDGGAAAKPTAESTKRSRNRADGRDHGGSVTAPIAGPDSGGGGKLRETRPPSTGSVTPPAGGAPTGGDTAPAEGPSAGAEEPTPAKGEGEAGASPPAWAPAHGLRCKEGGQTPGSPAFRDCVNG